MIVPLRRLVLIVLFLAAFALPSVAWAHGGPGYTAGPTTTPPTLDGSISAAEWADAPVYNLTFGTSPGTTIPATVRFEHTATDLYVGVVVGDLAPGTAPAPNISVLFDNNHDGFKNLGDDLWLDFAGQAGADFFYDPAPAGVASHYSDLAAGGTNETIASGTSASGAVTFEIKHPLCSNDSAHDMCARQMLGVDFQYEPGTAPGVFYNAPGPDLFDPSTTWADLQIATADVVRPSVTVTQPAPGALVSGTNVAVAADASDNVGVTAVDFYYYPGGGQPNVQLVTDTTAPYTATFDSTQVANVVAGGATMYATAHDAAGNTTTVGNGIGVSNVTTGGALAGTVIASPGSSVVSPTAVDLTAAGNQDWAIWGYANGGTSTSLAPDVRKAGGAAISSLANIDPAPSAPLRGLGQFAGPPFLFSWGDGGGTATAASVKGGIQHNGGPDGTNPGVNVSTLGKGFAFDVPADTATRALTIWVATNRASGQLTASLSDHSATDFVDTLPAAVDLRSGIYTIRYHAASANQTLRVRWVETVDNCGAVFRCDNAALYAAALSSDVTGATASLSTAATVGMSGSNDPLSSIPLRAFEPAPAGTTPAPINGLPINGLPINGLPINGLPINGLPINGLPINGLPINGLDVSASPINGLPINGLPINGLPINGLRVPGGWETVLAGTELAGMPLQTITLQQVLRLNYPNPPPPAVQNLTLGDLELADSALGRITIGALALGSTPINGLGTQAPSIESQLQTWCQSVVPAADAATSCTITNIGGQSLFALGLAGAPINGLPINGLPINGLPINGLPINGLPINGLDVSASPINGLPINGLPINGLPINGLPAQPTPINGLSLNAILSAHTPNGSPSPFGVIRIAALTNQSAVITSCAALDCVNGTLADAATVGAIKSTATLADIHTDVGSLTLGDLHFYGDLTIGDLERSLVGTNVTLGDLIGLLIKRSDVPWETLGARLLSVFDPSRPQLQMTAGFTLAGQGQASATLKVTLPDGFDVVPGSSTLGTDGQSPISDPAVNGNTLTWNLPLVQLGSAYALHFSTYSGTDVSPEQATETVSSGSVSDSSIASFAVTDSFEPNDNAAAVGLTAVPPETSVQQSAIASRGDVDYYKIPLPAAGTRLLVHLTNLPADYDLALYSDTTTSVRTGAISGAPLQDATIADQSINLQGGPNTQLTPTALQDVPDPGIQLVQASANRGSDDEDVGMVSPGGTGFATIAVFGYNGASSPKPYSLRVTTQAPTPVTCPARTFTGGGTAGSVPAMSSMPNDLNTLVLVNEKRIGDTYGATSESDVVTALTRFANDRSLGVSGAVLPVEGLAQAAYDTWDGNPCAVAAANSIANAIANKIAEVKAARPSLKYVVFAGGDDQIPFFRIPDLSRIANENGFASSFAQNEYRGALAQSQLLTDNPYLDTRPIPAGGRQLFVPDLIGGRLVEKPNQIVSAITRYETSSGTLARSTAFVSGYDFVTDGSALVESRLNRFLGTSPSRTLINNTWSKAQLLAAAFPTGGAAAINDWNGHYDNYQALAADGNQTNLISTADLSGAHALSGGIFFTMGCHAGFQTSDAIVGATSPDALDWSESFAKSGTSFVGNTGFGLGNTDSVAFSEELMADLAGNLDGSLSIGQALARAKQDYYLARTSFSSYDEKTLSEAELYGLPMYGVGTAPASLGAPLAPSAPASPDPVLGTTGSSSPAQGSLTHLALTTAQVASFDVVPHFSTKQSGAHGDYFTNGGQVQAPNYRPLQPFVTLPATRAGTTAHGVLIDGLTSADVTPFNPDNVRPTVDLTANEPEPQFAEEAWPTKVPALVSLDDSNGLRQSLNLTTGQFFTATGGAGVERLWTHIGGRVTYSSSTDFVPPTVDQIDAYLTGNDTVAFAGRFSDHTETGAAGTVALAQVVYDAGNTGAWQALQLAYDAASGQWSGGAQFAGTHVQYFVEACDTAGNCGYSSNKGRYFDAQPLPAQSGSITLTPSGSAGTGGWFTSPVGITAESSNRADVTVSVDGGAFVPPAGVTIIGDGAHRVDARASDGSEATTVVLIDGTAPEANFSLPDRARQGSAVQVGYTCVDRGSGVQTCSGTQGAAPVANGGSLDTSTLGSVTVTVAATDAAGNQRTVTGTVQIVSGPSVPGTPTADHPVNNGSFVLSWSPSTEPGYPITYSVERSTAPTGATWSVVATGLTLPSTTLGSQLQGRYYYRAVASDGAFTSTSVASDIVLIDGTLPNAPTLLASRAPDWATWFKGSVTITTVAQGDPAFADGSPGSGIDPSKTTGPQTITANGPNAVSGSVTDNASNTNTTTRTFNVDANKPTVVVTCPAQPVPVGTVVSASWTAVDGESGLRSAASGSVPLSTVHPGAFQSPTVTATDNVGHTAAPTTCSYTVVKATPTLTWPTPSSITYGTKLSATQLNATASVPGAFVYSPPAGTVLQPFSQLLSVTFTPTDTVDYTTATKSVTIAVGFSQPCITTGVAGPLTVASGKAVCISAGGRVSGSVTVQSGGSLWVSGGAISGSLTATKPLALTLCATSISGSLSVSGSPGYLLIGGISSTGCAGNSISSSVSITSNTGGLSFARNKVSQSVTITNNTGGFTYTDNAVSGTVKLSGNS